MIGMFLGMARAREIEIRQLERSSRLRRELAAIEAIRKGRGL